MDLFGIIDDDDDDDDDEGDDEGDDGNDGGGKGNKMTRAVENLHTTTRIQWPSPLAMLFVA